MIIPIKQALLEGYDLEAIVEAVHANHPNLNKSRLKDPATSYIEGKAIENNRKKLSDNIKHSRSMRDAIREFAAEGRGSADNVRENIRSANFYDNNVRARSQTGGGNVTHAAELKSFNYPKAFGIIRNKPRVISSAKQ